MKPAVSSAGYSSPTSPSGFVSRLRLLRLFLFPGLVVLPFVFIVAATESVALARWGIFFVGLTTVAQFSFWGNYLPRVYPTYLRGTGESFAANIGGRMLGTSAAIIATQLVNVIPGPASPPTKLAYAAAIVGTTAYVVAIISSWWLPEPARTNCPSRCRRGRPRGRRHRSSLRAIPRSVADTCPSG